MTETFNGWANYETWNVSLYIQNEYPLYKEAQEIARNGGTYQDLVISLRNSGSRKTPDGVRWEDTNIDGMEINEMMKDLV